MKNKSLIKLIFSLLIIVCSYQLLLTIPTYKVEQRAEQYAELQTQLSMVDQKEVNHKNYIAAYLDSISNEVIFEIPYILKYTYHDLKNQQLHLGLDLKGGMQITLGFESNDFISSLVEDNKQPTFLTAIEKTNQLGALTQDEYIHAFFDHYTSIETETVIKHQFLKHHNIKNKITPSTSINDLKKLVLQTSRSLLTEIKFLIEQRVNKLGIAQTQINIDLDKQHLLISVPDVNNPERVRKIILETASLEFWNTYRISDPGILEGLIKADKLLSQTEY